MNITWQKMKKMKKRDTKMTGRHKRMQSVEIFIIFILDSECSMLVSQFWREVIVTA